MCKGMCKTEDLRLYCVLYSSGHVWSSYVVVTPAEIIVVHLHK